jgi:hypothetical protein
MTYRWVCNSVTRQLPHVQQELPTLPEHLRSPLVFSGVGVARSLVFYVMFCFALILF